MYIIHCFLTFLIDSKNTENTNRTTYIREHHTATIFFYQLTITDVSFRHNLTINYRLHIYTLIVTSIFHFHHVISLCHGNKIIKHRIFHIPTKANNHLIHIRLCPHNSIWPLPIINRRIQNIHAVIRLSYYITIIVVNHFRSFPTIESYRNQPVKIIIFEFFTSSSICKLRSTQHITPIIIFIFQILYLSFFIKSQYTFRQ